MKSLQVEDDELIGAFLDMVENHKMIVENSGLLTVAALKQLDCKGKKVVCVLSGGNMDVITMSSDRTAWSDPERPDLLGFGASSGQAGRTGASVAANDRRCTGQRDQAGAQPVCQHEPERGCGASYYDGGIRNRT